MSEKVSNESTEIKQNESNQESHTNNGSTTPVVDKEEADAGILLN